jgi:hypothetical protein|tara:strand:- start:1941 stop:2093 length:153 start_codon:yes stop_codon:yes gene_type:complete
LFVLGRFLGFGGRLAAAAARGRSHRKTSGTADAHAIGGIDTSGDTSWDAS